MESWRGYLHEVAIGQCYPFAYDLARKWMTQHIDRTKPRGKGVHPDIDNKEKFKVVHGRTTNKWSDESVLHAWVEKGDQIFDWQTHATKPDGIDRETYYDTYQPEPHEEYTAEETVTQCMKQGHHGPWTDKQ